MFISILIFYLNFDNFRESLFGDHKYFFLDGIMIVIGAYIGANAMVVYLHANRAICYEYKKFNKRIQDHIKDGSITVSVF